MVYNAANSQQSNTYQYPTDQKIAENFWSTYVHRFPFGFEPFWIRTLTVPLHLDLIDGPFVLRNLISVQDSPVPSRKFQMAPRLKILMSSGSKKGIQIYFYSLKNPGKRTASRFPNRAPMERDTRLHGIFKSFLIYLLSFPRGPR